MTANHDSLTDFLTSTGSDGPSKADKVIDTHAATVVLHPSEAFKIKRPVKYDYLDASTLDRRAAMLRREIELNAQGAPGLYRDVVPITREGDGSLAIDGDGTLVEWVLRMARFPAEAELSVMADRGCIDVALADALGARIADYHGRTPRIDAPGSTLIGEIIDELDRMLGEMTDRLGTEPVARFVREARQAHTALAPMLDGRTRAGWVRRCHGDLHLRNLVMWRGVPTPFDALEFDERLGTCDVLYDLAFLLMDLAHRGLDYAANRVLNAYLYAARSDAHLGALGALPLFLSVRAAIRAMVDVQTAEFQDDPDPLLADAVRFLDQALAYLDRPSGCLVAIGGLSGSGKTTVAHDVAPFLGAFPGAVHLRSDLERKALFGVDPMTHLPPDAYDQGVSAQVYDALHRKARHALAAGQAVILDAVYSDAAERAKAEAIATDLGVEFRGLWLDAGTETRAERVRSRAPDASDANEAVARQQGALATGPIAWARIETKGMPSESARQAARLLGLAGSSGRATTSRSVGKT